MQKNGTINVHGREYTYEAEVYDKPVPFGIRKGRVGALKIFDKTGRVVAERNRNRWDIYPNDPFVCNAISAVRELYK